TDSQTLHSFPTRRSSDLQALPKPKENKTMTKDKLELYALEGRSFDVATYRGYGRLSELASVSAPDTFDINRNPDGYQRDVDKQRSEEHTSELQSRVDLVC